MLFQPIKGFSIVHKGFSIITKVFIIINRVFSIINKVVDPRSNLVGSRTFAELLKVLQGTTHLCKGSKALDVRVLGSSKPVHYKRGLGGINDYLWGHCKSMLASMTIHSTTFSSSFSIFCTDF